MFPIKYHMNNIVNNTEVKIEGSGFLSSDGQMSLALSLSEKPKDWTGIIVPCICSGPGPGAGGGNAPRPRLSPDGSISTEQIGGLIHYAPKGYKTAPGTLRRATLFDSNRKPIASVDATGVYALLDDKLDFNIQVKTETNSAGLLERLTKIDHYFFSISPVSAGRVLVYAHYSLSTATSEKVYSFTQIHYELIDSTALLPEDFVGFKKFCFSKTETLFNIFLTRI